MLVAVLTLLFLVLLLAWRLREVRHQRRAAILRLARATGHPSALGRSPADWGDRRALAVAAADHLAGLGLVAERIVGRPIVRAQGLAGDYLVTITGDGVLAEYETPDGRLMLADTTGVDAAVRAIARHAELPDPV